MRKTIKCRILQRAPVVNRFFNLPPPHTCRLQNQSHNQSKYFINPPYKSNSSGQTLCLLFLFLSQANLIEFQFNKSFKFDYKLKLFLSTVCTASYTTKNMRFSPLLNTIKCPFAEKREKAKQN